MIPSLHRISLGLLAAFAALALATGYWAVARSEVLSARTDNPRLFIAETRLKRGAILEAEGGALAETRGRPGDFVRLYEALEAAHVVGYASLRFGVAGIEAAENEVLRGAAAEETFGAIWEREVLGRPQVGRDVRLTLEAELQRAAFDSLGDEVGAVVVLDAASGAVLAMVSSPHFDANGLDEDWEMLLDDPRSPLLNRATLGSYQPGGALQPLILAAAMERGLAASSDKVTKAGLPIDWQGSPLQCAGEIGETATLAEALASACPAPFAELGVRLGANDLEAILAGFGLYTAPAFSLDTVASPLEPIQADAVGLRLAAAGQGDLRVSPLQMALATAAIANGGVVPPLQLVAEAQAADGQWVGRGPLGQAQAALGTASAEAAASLWVRSPAGVAGHTANALTGPEAEPVGWYLGFVNDGTRTLVIAVAVENGSAERAQSIGWAVLGG